MNRWQAAAGVIAVGFWACNGELLRIEVNADSETTIAKGTLLEELVGDVGFGDFLNMDITAASELANQGVQPGDIQDVRLVSFTLEATGPEGADLGFITSLDVFVSAPGEPRVLMASQADFGDGTGVIEMELEDVDLTPYAVSQSMTIEVEVEGSRPDVDTRVKAAYGLSIGVTAQGACNAITGASGS